jgi:Resolvase, N terminal domain
VPAEWVFEDDGCSGATLVRPALERLRDLVCQVPVEVVLCYAPDRLARKYAYQGCWWRSSPGPAPRRCSSGTTRPHANSTLKPPQRRSTGRLLITIDNDYS